MAGDKQNFFILWQVMVLALTIAFTSHERGKSEQEKKVKDGNYSDATASEH